MSTHGFPRQLRPTQHAATNPHRFGSIRAALAVVLTILLFFGSFFFFVFQSLATQVRHSALDISDRQKQQSGETVGMTTIDQFKGRAVNILVSGVDSRYNQDDSGYGSSEELTTIQSDTTMVAHVSADRSAVTVVSIPRDLITDIPSCVLSSGEETYPYEGMFNSAFATGAVTNDLAGGVACTKAAVEQLTGLTMDAFVVVDFTGFKGMIDALGGVWFDVPEDMYDTYSGLDVSAGCQRFDSTTALAFARARKEVGDGSDLSRIGRQQQLVSAMLRELLSKNFITDFPSLLSFLQASIGSLTVSSNLADIRADAGLLMSLLGIDRAAIRFVMMPNMPAEWDPNRVVVTEPDTSKLWATLASDEALPPGFTYTDGSGTQQVIPDPSSDSSTAEDTPEGTDTSGTPHTLSDTLSQADTSATTNSQTQPAPVATCPPGN